MKKNILCAFVALLALLVQARTVSSEEAKLAACAWAERNAAFGVSAADVGVVEPFADANGVKLWYQVQMGTSCLIVSPVTEIEPVIAALENVDAAAGLPAGHPMLAMLTRDMTDRLRKLELYKPAGAAGGTTLLGAAPSGGDAAPSDPAMAAWAEEGKGRWTRLLPKAGPQLMAAPETGVTEIDIQMGIVDGFEKGGRFTHWDQGAVGGYPCYNYCTPNNAVCGCVATSMAAMMQFFSVTGCVTGATCPSGLVRETQDGIVGASYNGEGAGTWKTLGGDYDWSILSNKTDRAGYNSLTVEERELLGRVAYDCGVAVAMQWTSGESGAYVMDVAAALREVFGFKDARAVFQPTEEQYVKLIYHQCRAGAPVQLGINMKVGEGGHSVLAVGFGTDDEGIPRVRIFTGWGGSGDGWYALPYITTASIPGGGSYNFDVIQQVVTMVGYDSDETVPVVGHMDAPSEAIEVPGASRTIYSNENGYFGTRVSPSLSDCRLVCRGKDASFAIGAEAAVTEGEYWVTDVDALCSALPEEIEFILLNCSVAYTFEQAKEMALAEGKAILRISGVPGDEATTNLLSYIYALDESNEGGFTNKFVYFFSSAKASNPDLPDGNPSIGVFLPENAEQGGRWQYTNGRLSYGYGYSTVLEQTVTNDYEVAEDEMFYTITNEAYVATWGQLGTPQYTTTNLPYTIEGLLDGMVPLVLDNGWDEFCRRTHGVVLTVTAEPAESGLPDPLFGTYENTYTNGQEITALAPDGQVTNDAQTVISEFSAWELTVTNTAAGGEATVTKGTGKTAAFTLASNDVATLVWELEPKFVWIDIKVDDDGWEDDGNSVSPGSDWYPYGETVTFTATAAAGFSFNQWVPQLGKQLPDYLDSFRKQADLSFSVEEPLYLVAYFNAGDPQEEAVSTADQTLTVWAAEMEIVDGEYSYVDTLFDDNMPEVDVTLSPDGGSQQVTMDDDEIDLPAGTSAVATLASNTFTDADDVEWKCVGWILADEQGKQLAQGNGTVTSRIVLKSDAQLIWLWVSSEEEEEDPDGPLGPAEEPKGAGDGSPLTIYSNADGTLTVKADIANAAKGWWYVLLTAETVSGEYVPVSATAEEDVCAKKADENDVAPGTLVLQATFTPTEEKRFYKVRVQEDEP